MNRLDIRETHPNPHAGGWVRATPADAKMLVDALGNQLPVAVYSGGRVIGRMIGARRQGTRILAEIDLIATSNQTNRCLDAPDPNGGESHEIPYSCVGGCALQRQRRAGQWG